MPANPTLETVAVIAWTGDLEQLAVRWRIPADRLREHLRALSRPYTKGGLTIDLDATGTVALSRLRSMVDRRANS